MAQGNTLSQRKNAARRMLANSRDMQPAFICQRLRREERRFVRLLDLTPDAEVDRLVSIWGVLHRLRGQILEIILYPRRPGSPILKGPRNAVRADEIMLATVSEVPSERSNGLKTGQPSDTPLESAGL